jgi:hypothetical protein
MCLDLQDAEDIDVEHNRHGAFSRRYANLSERQGPVNSGEIIVPLRTMISMSD